MFASCEVEGAFFFIFESLSMSWNPFNKLIAPKKPIGKSFDDTELEAQFQQVVQAENLTKKLHKDAKKCLESGANLAKLEQRIAHELVNSSKQIKDAEQVTEHAERLGNVSSQTEDSQQQRDATIRLTFLQPMKGLCEKFPPVHSAIKRREQSQQDYLKYLSRKEKLSRDPSSTQSGKYDANEKYLERTKGDFDRRTRQLNEDLPKFLNERFSYFDPCFKALMQSYQSHNEASKSLYDQLNTELDISLPLNDQEFETTTEKMLEDIRALSIVKVK